MATAKEVLRELQKLPPEQLEKELKIWLPGSTIRLGGMSGAPLVMAFQKGSHTRYLMIEGNVDRGSALSNS